MTKDEALAIILEKGFRIGPLHFWWARRRERLQIALAFWPHMWHLMTPEQRAVAEQLEPPLHEHTETNVIEWK